MASVMALGVGFVQEFNEHINNLSELWLMYVAATRADNAPSFQMPAPPTKIWMSTLESCRIDHWSESCHDVVDGAFVDFFCKNAVFLANSL